MSESLPPLSRRQALLLSGGLLVACRQPLLTPAPAPVAVAGPPPDGPRDPAVACAETHDNIEGPYYRAGAPERSSLVTAKTAGTPLELRGRVRGLGCEGLAGAELDVWHATHDGHYDNDGTMRVAREEFLLRGRIRTDAEGRFVLRTIVPGRYLNGPRYRPAHVHVKLRAKGFAPLTTQLYFPDDPYNQGDPFIHPSLVVAIDEAKADRVRANYDFVLRPSPG